MTAGSKYSEFNGGNLQQFCCVASTPAMADILTPSIKNHALTYAGAVSALPVVPDHTFGIPPFFIARGPHQDVQHGAPFEFGAPTTSRNALRVLRALQLRRSVLLEGSPGVGKTALVAALARATGRPHFLRQPGCDQPFAASVFHLMHNKSILGNVTSLMREGNRGRLD